MAKANTKGKTIKSKTKKRSRFHLKRSARWTIAGVLLATAIIIALIPVQGGGVSATSGNDSGPFSVTPSFEKIVGHTGDSVDGGQAVFKNSDMSVTADSGSQEYYGYPIKHEGDITPHELVFIDGTSDNAAAIQIDMSDFYEYEMRDKNNNIINQGSGAGEWNRSANDKFFILADKLPSSETDKSIFRMGSKDSAGAANTITQYVGGKNGYITNGVVSLDDGTVGYSTSDWGYEYRQLTVKKYPEKVDGDEKGLGVPDKSKEPIYQETFLICTNRATVQYIADNAFKKSDEEDPANIVTLTLPQNLLRIGNNAFQGQANIKAIEGGQSLTNIGKQAFEGCSSLASVSFNETVAPLENVGDGAFANCTALNSIAFPNNTRVIGSGVFYGCKSLNDCDGDAVSEDSSRIFARTKGTDIPIKLGNYVFAGCERLSNIALDKDVSEMGVGTFADCPQLSTVVMPVDINANYSPDTFANDSNLKYVRVPNDDKAHFFKNSDGSEAMTSKPCIFVTSTNQKQNTAGYTPGSDVPLEPLTMGQELFCVWGLDPAAGNSNIHKFAQTYGITYMYERDGVIYYELTLNGYTFSFNQDGLITGCVCAEGIPQEENLEIPKKIGGVEITGIAPNAFNGFQGNSSGYPKSVIIPDTVKTIGDNAFNNCGTIKYVDITTKGVNIGNSAFAGNTELETVAFTQNDPIGDTTIGNSCFEGDKKLSLVTFRNTGLDQDNINVVNVTAIGDKAFYTGNDNGLTMQGDMRPGYMPYDFAINPNNRTSAGAYSYITYKTGNPDNLVCKYDKALDAVSLISYPCADTIVGKDTSGNNITIHDLEEKKAKFEKNPSNPQPSVMELYILDKYKNIIVPDGIDTVEKAVATDGGTHGNPAFKNVYEDSSSTYTDGETASIPCNNKHTLQTLQLLGVDNIPDHACANDTALQIVVLDGEIEYVGDKAFENCPSLYSVQVKGNVSDPDMPRDTFYGCSNLKFVSFEGEGNKEEATSADPYYWCEDGIIYKYDGNETLLVECLPGVESVTVREDVDRINNNAFDNCDKLVSADLSNCKNVTTIPERCFYDCNALISVILPESCDSIYDEAFGFPGPGDTPVNNLDVTMMAHEIYIRDDAFNHRVNPVNPDSPHTTIHSYDDTAAKRYTSRFNNKVKFISDQYDDVTIRFVYYKDNEVVIDEIKVPYNSIPDPIPEPPVDGRKGFEYMGVWDSYITPAVGFKQYTAKYKEITDTSSSSTSTSGSTSGTNTPSSSGSSSGNSSSSKSSSSSSTSGNGTGSSASTSARHAVVSGAPAPVGMVGAGAAAPTGTANAGTATNPAGNGVATGNTNVVSTTKGISNNGKMSATVNGSSDNYIIKLTETAEADEAARQALSGAFGTLDNIRYMPFDISLYDSTGTQKITPVPEGVTVSVTMPIPDDLAVYGGNNKVASTSGGTLEVIQPRFTVIDGVPCMNFTVSHLSPYVIYVDTANLTADGTLDSTPKTGDPIHPKWFLVIGLTAISIFLFLKRDKERTRIAG